MTQPHMDWESLYRGDIAPPWSIGAPQPELAALIQQGEVRSDVLDAGCGHAELALSLAGGGYTVVGLDASATAVASAAGAAAERGLSTATFAQADLTDFHGYDARFATVMDSGLLHSLPVDRRQAYLQAIHRAAAPEAKLFVLAFDKHAFGGQAPGPGGFTAEDLRETVAAVWTVDFVRSAKLYANDVPMPEGAPPTTEVERNAEGRLVMPAWLLGAHKAN
ncbi:class I SAM-dependent methyltransferase [Mycobacterium sp. DBP42]|uniref:class I SAM-dependent methyltransferase n=1 Tax=Mycobacterium sp. DBP42 TaxID=2545267 RepID=UPI0014872970|nr:class I SAM-dependent methyltransferase [Mycobacterium sp. DBP42]